MYIHVGMRVAHTNFRPHPQWKLNFLPPKPARKSEGLDSPGLHAEGGNLWDSPPPQKNPYDRDRIWENPPHGIFRENHNRSINSTTSELTLLQVIACSVSEIRSLLCDDTRTIELKKLRSKGVAMRAHPAAVYDECTYIDCGRGLSI